MSLYRSFLWWLLLAALGALAWELLQPDFGEVVIRWHGTTITTTVAFSLLVGTLFLFALWFIWYLVRLPYHAWRGYAQKQAKSRLNNGLTAFYEGRYGRAQNLLAKAAEERNVRDLALLGARQAAIAQEDWVSAARFLERLNASNPDSGRLQQRPRLAETRQSPTGPGCDADPPEQRVVADRARHRHRIGHLAQSIRSGAELAECQRPWHEPEAAGRPEHHVSSALPAKRELGGYALASLAGTGPESRQRRTGQRLRAARQSARHAEISQRSLD